MKTRLTEILEIEHPIILAPMAWITDASLAAAVSNAGGLGTIGPNAGMRTVTTDVEETGERLRSQIRECRAMTDRPFAVNFVVGVPGWDRDFSDRCVQVGIEEKIPVAIVSQGSPAVYTRRLKEAGMRVVHVCSNVRHARKAQETGVDAVVVSGTEGGGHSGFDQMTTFCLVPQAAEAIRIPLAAGGGVVDARGVVGALALGADGVYMGTRFIATKECPAHENVKQAILQAQDTSTMAVRHGSPAGLKPPGAGDRGFVEERRGSVRILINDYILNAMAQKGGTLSYEDFRSVPGDVDPNTESNRTVRAFLHGEIQENAITVGQGAGLIRDVPTCAELIHEIMEQAEGVLDRLDGIRGK